MRSFFWPTSLNPSPGVLTRLGRVLHWIATAIAVFLFCPAVFYTGWAIYTQITDVYGIYTSPSAQLSFALGFLVFGLLIYFAGRAIRYVFSGE